MQRVGLQRVDIYDVHLLFKGLSLILTYGNESSEINEWVGSKAWIMLMCVDLIESQHEQIPS